MLNPNFVFLGVTLQFFGGISYLVDTIKGKVQPNKVSWLLWSTAPLIAFYAEVKQGVGLQSLTTFIVGFVPLLIFIASFFNKAAKWKLGKLDVACGTLSVLGLILWLVTNVGNVAILFSILADGLAAIPTIVKSYKEPESENDLVFLFGIINAVIGLLIIKEWNFQHWGFPIYLVFLCTLLTILIRFKLGKKITTLFRHTNA
jgi:hypothetical protein